MAIMSVSVIYPPLSGSTLNGCAMHRRCSLLLYLLMVNDHRVLDVLALQTEVGGTWNDAAKCCASVFVCVCAPQRGNFNAREGGLDP